MVEPEGSVDETVEAAAETVEDVIESEGGAAAEAPAADEPATGAVVEEPETPEAAAIEETIQNESGEEPGEATGDK